MDENIFVKLRDCFTAGYTLPQFCIDNGITKPLFVSEQKFKLLLWEIYVQFQYDKRMTAHFGFFDANAEVELNYSFDNTVRKLKVQPVSAELTDDCDKIIVLSADKDTLKSDKAIYLDALEDECILKAYYEIPVLHFLQRCPQVKLIVTKFPIEIKQYKGGAKFEKALPTTTKLRNLLLEDSGGKVKTKLSRLGYTNQEVLELVEAPRFVKNPDGTTLLQENPDRLLHPIKGGKMVTAYQPETWRNKIYFVGSCYDFGINAPFDKTVESYLQRLLNKHNLPYRVENEGQHYFGRWQDIFYNLNALTLAPDDIIFIWLNNLLPKTLPGFDLSDAFAPPHDYRKIFVEKKHGNELGYKILARKYFKCLTANNFFRDVKFKYPPPPAAFHRYGIPPQFEFGNIVQA